jgi:CRISPR-associated protein Cmr2
MEAWNRYQSSLKQLDCMRESIGRRFAAHPVIQHTDASIFFEERLPELLGDPPMPELLGDPPTAHVQSARDELTAFLKQTVGQENRPKPYYALLLADGDRMGKIIDNQDTPSKHRALSQALDRFALHTKVIVENEHQGSLFYSGGDDVLAMVPLHTVLQCAQALATDFKERLQHFTDEEGNGPTLSVGIAVTHHIEPMSDALDLARQAEKEAKKTRNALAVTVSKRSGSDRTVAGAWDTIDEQLETFILFHRLEQIPDGAAYELVRLADDPGDALPDTALRQEAIRILRRKRTSDDQKIEKTILEKLEKQVALTQNAHDLKQLAHKLIVARLFADAMDLAYGELAHAEQKEQAS